MLVIDTKKHSDDEKFRTVYLFCGAFSDTISSQALNNIA